MATDLTAAVAAYSGLGERDRKGCVRLRLRAVLRCRVPPFERRGAGAAPV